ncbi:hypothetical protein HYW75_00245 [Candidatus Pacearchaeota archaeon]|nr:hypothetical protein [Candidatus Pacearchaeota archaeon]
MIPKCSSLPELLNYCKYKGFPTLLCNAGQSNESLLVAETYADKASAIITHDANNTFPTIFEHIPVIENAIGKYSKSSNKRAKNLVDKLSSDTYIAGIAVSSSHYLHQIGRAGIFVETMPVELKNTKSFLSSLNAILSSQIFENKENFNSVFDVLKFGYLLSRYGSAPNRFKGTISSYNEQITT